MFPICKDCFTRFIAVRKTQPPEVSMEVAFRLEHEVVFIMVVDNRQKFLASRWKLEYQNFVLN